MFLRSDVELVLVDNGSTDESPQVLAELLPTYPFARSVRVEKNQGYGFGILSGLRVAQGHFIGWTHADMQTDPADAIRALELLLNEKHPEQTFFKGRRYGRPLGDVIFTVGMSIFETIVLRARLWDINAQPTIFSQQFFASWKNPPHDFSLDLYAYYQARKAGLRIERLPVFFGKRLHGVSHWNINWRAKIKFIKRTLAFTFELRKELFKSTSAA